MTTHTAPFYYGTGQTLTAKLFNADDTLAKTASSVVEATNRKQRYVPTFTDVSAGDYMMVYYIGTDAVGYEIVRFTGADNEVGVLLLAQAVELDSATAAKLDAIPRSGQTKRYTQVASGATTTDVLIGEAT